MSPKQLSSMNVSIDDERSPIDNAFLPPSLSTIGPHKYDPKPFSNVAIANIKPVNSVGALNMLERIIVNEEVKNIPTKEIHGNA